MQRIVSGTVIIGSDYRRLIIRNNSLICYTSGDFSFDGLDQGMQ